MRKFFRLLCLALCGLCLLLPSALSESLPPCQGVVTDLAGVLSTDTAAGLETLAQRMEAAGCGRLYVVTRHFLGGKDARAYADRLFAAWGLQDKDGLLLLAVGEETYALSLGSAAQAANSVQDGARPKARPARMHTPPCTIATASSGST